MQVGAASEGLQLVAVATAVLSKAGVQRLVNVSLLAPTPK